MANPERNTVYTNDGDRTVYKRESSGTGWFVGIIVVLALLAIGYLVFSANTGPATVVEVENAPVIETPADPAVVPAPTTEVTPMTEAVPPAEAITPIEDGVAAPAAPTDPVVVTDPVAPPAEPVVETEPETVLVPAE